MYILNIIKYRNNILILYFNIKIRKMASNPKKEEIIKEDVENVVSDYDSMARLSKYTDVLKNKEKVDIKIGKNEPFSLKMKSLTKICTLSSELPEEKVMFTLYVEEEEAVSSNKFRQLKNEMAPVKKPDNQTVNRRFRGMKTLAAVPNDGIIRYKGDPKTKNKKKSDKLDYKLVLSDEEEDEEGNDKVLALEVAQKNKKIRSYKRSKTVGARPMDMLKKSVYLPKDVSLKSNIVQKLKNDGYLMAQDPLLFSTMWRNMYKMLPFFGGAVLAGLGYFMYKNLYVISVPEVFNYVILGLISYTAYSGSAKMLSTKIVDFKSESVMLSAIISICFYTILACKIPFFGGFAFEFLNDLFTPILCVYVSLIMFSLVLIHLNRKMMAFYREYYKKLNEERLLSRYY